MHRVRPSRLAGQALRAAGLGLMLVAVVAFAGPRIPAYAALGPALVAQTVPEMQNVIPLGTPTPSPSPSPAPFAGQEVIRGGPLTFRLSGSLGVGTRIQSTNQGNGGTGFPVTSPSPSASPTPVAGFANTTTSSNSTNQSLGLQAELTRRTATTLTDFKIPVSFGGSGGTQFAQVSGLYSTPKYSLAYGPQPVLIFGMLPLGGTLRGYSLVLPTSTGDETFYTGPSNGINDEAIKMYGFRWRGVEASNFYEAGVTTAYGQQSGRSETL